MSEAEIRAEASELDAEAQRVAEKGIADNTRRAYARVWNEFTLWCQRRRHDPDAADETVIKQYLVWLVRTRELSLATVELNLASIATRERALGHVSPSAYPIVRAYMRGLRRELGRQQKQRTPADLKRLISGLPTAPEMLAIRNRALLLLGFYGGFRRSVVVGLDVEDVQETAVGLRVTITKDKNDQEKAGRKVAISREDRVPDLCPVRAWRAWLDASGLTAGPLFVALDPSGRRLAAAGERLSDKAVWRIVKTTAKRAGLDWTDFGGHSLRRGYATTAYAAGAPVSAIQEHLGHASSKQTKRYIEDQMADERVSTTQRVQDFLVGQQEKP